MQTAGLHFFHLVFFPSLCLPRFCLTFTLTRSSSCSSCMRKAVKMTNSSISHFAILWVASQSLTYRIAGTCCMHASNPTLKPYACVLMTAYNHTYELTGSCVCKHTIFISPESLLNHITISTINKCRVTCVQKHL